MRVCFVLPGSGHKPVGGFKVVYEYANGLAKKGHTVTVVHTALLRKDTNFFKKIKKKLRYVQRSMDKSFLPDHWFAVDKRVRLVWVPSLHQHNLPDADVVIATAWQTAEWVTEYPASKGEKLYLIQHFEGWSGPEERVRNTWKLDLRKIVISNWLKEYAYSLGEKADYIPNGLNFKAFFLEICPKERDNRHVMMLYHDLQWKGTYDGLKALNLTKEQYPDLKVSLFGVPSPPSNLPNWMIYYRNPAQEILRKLYNEATVFVSPSWTEGWGLPCCEAMMCGAKSDSFTLCSEGS
jgi:glycosyltransferase involved in cell wall biosynthesis